MSALTMPTAATAALPAVNLPSHGHGHGHKKASPLDPAESSSTAAPIPAGTAPSLFGSLFSAIQQVLGVQPAGSATATAPAAASANAAGSAAAGSAAAAKINVMA